MTRTEQRFTFDEVAELYDRTRPGYPAELFDALVAQSGLSPVARLLEVGCGTGQATAPLAERGFQMLCLEPGESMFQIARRNAERFDRVEVVHQTFEDWPIEEAGFDLVVSAQAFHWVDPAIRFQKAARTLRAGGTLALIGNVGLATATPVWADVGCAYAEHVPTLAGPSPTRWYDPEGPIRELVAESGCFSAVDHQCFPWSRHYSADDYVDLMSTHSDHRLLPPDQRRALMGAIRDAIVGHGGTIEMRYDAHLYLARL